MRHNTAQAIKPEMVIAYHRQRTAIINATYKALLPSKISDLKTLKNLLLHNYKKYKVDNPLNKLSKSEIREYLDILGLAGQESTINAILETFNTETRYERYKESIKETIKYLDNRIREYQRIQATGQDYEIHITETDLYQYQKLNRISQNIKTLLSSFYTALYRGDISKRRQKFISIGFFSPLLKKEQDLFISKFMKTI